MLGEVIAEGKRKWLLVNNIFMLSFSSVLNNKMYFYVI